MKRSATAGPGGELAFFPEVKVDKPARKRLAWQDCRPVGEDWVRKTWRCTCASGGPARRKDSAFDAGGGSWKRPHGVTASYRCNSNYQILQSPGYVTILIEMIHDVPIIPHISQNIRRWLGDSLGHW